MARNFRHKRAGKPERDRMVFKLMRLMRGRKTKDIAELSGCAKSTISKIRTRRTRYPFNYTVDRILTALEIQEKYFDKDGKEIDV